MSITLILLIITSFNYGTHLLAQDHSDTHDERVHKQDTEHNASVSSHSEEKHLDQEDAHQGGHSDAHQSEHDEEEFNAAEVILHHVDRKSVV